MSCCCPFFQGEGTAELGLGGPSTWEVEDEWNGEEESEEEEIVTKGDLGTRAVCALQYQLFATVSFPYLYGNETEVLCH